MLQILLNCFSCRRRTDMSVSRMILGQISEARLFEPCLSVLAARHGQSPRTPTGPLLLRKASSGFVLNLMCSSLNSPKYLRRSLLRQHYTVQTAVPYVPMISRRTFHIGRAPKSPRLRDYLFAQAPSWLPDSMADVEMFLFSMRRKKAGECCSYSSTMAQDGSASTPN
jgi:hypothetical protein